MPKRALIIRHNKHETLGANYISVLNDRGFDLLPLNVFEGEPNFADFDPPPPKDLDLIIALGGAYSANDDLPAIHAERNFFADAISAKHTRFRRVPRRTNYGSCPRRRCRANRRLRVRTPQDLDHQRRRQRPRIQQTSRVPLVPTLHGECFSIPHGASELAFGYMLCRDGTFRRQSLAFRHGNSYAFQFEPQLTLDELKIWDRELASDYELMGPLFDPKFEAEANLREFTSYSPIYEAQSREMLIAFLENAGLA